ncbi:MAG: DUF2927 domain-containing protein [Pseudomonadota bacterium]
MRSVFGFVALALLAACAPRSEPFRTAPLPKDPGYLSAVPAGDTAFDNEDLAHLFVQLTHGLETGEYRQNLQRFEGPVNVGMTGPGSTDYQKFLRRFLAEIRKQAGVDISVGAPPHDLLIQMVPGEELLPRTTAQCFVIFAQPTWEEFKANPSRYEPLVVDASGPQQKIGIMIPDTIEPFKVRECLLEEIPQALGPANDLYGLANTIFNDDDAHTWPTKLDYLMLEVLYDERLESGLSQAETLTLAQAVLDDVNPEGVGAPKLPPVQQDAFLDWRGSLHRLSVDGEPIVLQNVRKAAAEARRKAPFSAYDCTGATILAIVTGNATTRDADKLLEEAIKTCKRAHGIEDVRVAQLRLIKALRHLGGERYRRAREQAQAVLPVFLAHGLEDEIADAKITIVRASAGLRDPNWRNQLPDATAWSAFVFGDDHTVTETLRE